MPECCLLRREDEAHVTFLTLLGVDDWQPRGWLYKAQKGAASCTSFSQLPNRGRERNVLPLPFGSQNIEGHLRQRVLKFCLTVCVHKIVWSLEIVRVHMTSQFCQEPTRGMAKSKKIQSLCFHNFMVNSNFKKIYKCNISYTIAKSISSKFCSLSSNMPLGRYFGHQDKILPTWIGESSNLKTCCQIHI